MAINHKSKKASFFRKFSCPVCQKRFFKKQTMNSHLTSVHYHIRSFQCSQCLKRFSKKYNLKRHQLTHQSKISYACPRCQIKFSSKAKQVEHVAQRNCAAKGPLYEFINSYRGRNLVNLPLVKNREGIYLNLHQQAPLKDRSEAFQNSFLINNYNNYNSFIFCSKNETYNYENDSSLEGQQPEPKVVKHPNNPLYNLFEDKENNFNAVNITMNGAINSGNNSVANLKSETKTGEEDNVKNQAEFNRLMEQEIEESNFFRELFTSKNNGDNLRDLLSKFEEIIASMPELDASRLPEGDISSQTFEVEQQLCNGI